MPDVSQEAATAEALVVEDDADARRLVAVCLRRLGLRVMEAATGAEAGELLDRSVPDVICLDLRLPDGSGLALCERIRSTARLRDVPVVVISALTQPADLVKAEVAGANGYLTKPFRVQALAESIREVLALSSVAAS
jgi:CheY-like chemotaxis protein